jgi:hypothetical protein
VRRASAAADAQTVGPRPSAYPSITPFAATELVLQFPGGLYTSRSTRSKPMAFFIVTGLIAVGIGIFSLLSIVVAQPADDDHLRLDPNASESLRRRRRLLWGSGNLIIGCMLLCVPLIIATGWSGLDLSLLLIRAVVFSLFSGLGIASMVALVYPPWGRRWYGTRWAQVSPNTADRRTRIGYWAQAFVWILLGALATRL